MNNNPHIDKKYSEAFQPTCQWPKHSSAVDTTFSIPYQDPLLEPRGLDSLPNPQPPTQQAFHAIQQQHPYSTNSNSNQAQPPTQQGLHTAQHQHPYSCPSNWNKPQPPRAKLESFWNSNFIRGIERIDMSLEPTVPRHLNFITGNKNKLAEVQAILEGVIELRSQNVDLVEIQGTVEEVTTDKCRRAAEEVQGPVLVEDTCLCFKAMNDLPGPYIKWFMLAIGPLKLHHMLDGFEDKSAQAVCTFAYSQGPGHEPVLFQGRTDGKLVASRGSTVFGWDSCFEYEGKTYAEMDKAEKNKISHRGKALDKLKEWLARRADA